MKKSYKEQTREYIKNWVDFDEDFKTYGPLTDLDHLAEIIIDSIDTEYPDDESKWDDERDKKVSDVYDVLLNEYKEKIDAAIANRKPEFVYEIRDREAGNVIDEADSYDEALEIIKKYEDEDRADRNYTPDFYEINKREIKGGKYGSNNFNNHSLYNSL